MYIFKAFGSITEEDADQLDELIRDVVMACRQSSLGGISKLIALGVALGILVARDAPVFDGERAGLRDALYFIGMGYDRAVSRLAAESGVAGGDDSGFVS